MKKLVSLILASAIFLAAGSSVFAEGERISLDVDRAIEYALANSPKIEKAQTELDRCKHTETLQRRNYNDFVSSGMSFEEALTESGYTYKAVQVQTAQAERNLESEKNSLKTSVKQSFYTCLNSKAKEKTAENNLENTKQKYEQSKSRYEQGQISRLDLRGFELSVTNAQNALSQAQRNSALAELQLKNILNISDDTPVTLIGEFEMKDFTYADDKTALEEAQKQNSFLSINEGRELAAIRFKIANGWYASNEVGFSVEKATYASAMAGFADSENTLKYNISSLYSNLLTLKETTAYLADSTELMRENAEAAYLQYELGMITSTDYIETSQKYFDAQNNLIDTQLNYYITALEYVTMYSGCADI